MCHCHDLGDSDCFSDDDLLYRRVHESHLKDGKLTPAHCPTKQWRKGLSCDWSAKVGPEQTVKTLPNYVLEISVQDCKSLGIDVQYAPIEDETSPNYNLAHCLLVLPPDIRSSKLEIRKIRDEFVEKAEIRLLVAEKSWWQRVVAWMRSWLFGLRNRNQS